MKYFEFIDNIIKTRGQWNPPSKYWEGHHIIPRCLGGEGKNRSKHENVIWLTLEEHKIAHELLNNDFPQIKRAWRHKISKNHVDVSGSNNPMFGNGYKITGEKNGMFGKKQTEHQKRLDSKYKKKWHAEHPGESFKKLNEWRLNNPELYSLAQSRPGGKNGRALKVRCVETKEVFECIKYATDWLRINKKAPGIKNIKACCDNLCDTAGGYHWEFA